MREGSAIKHTPNILGLFAAAIFFVAGFGWGGTTTVENPVEVQLISEVSCFVPGTPFTVGVAIHHHEKFHTYWHSPGTVGLATMVNWKLPEGFAVSELEWPVPERCKMEGYNTHGYERDVILLATVTPPEGFTGEAVLKASVTWMACSVGKCCNVQHATKELRLVGGRSAVKDPDAARRIHETRAGFAVASPQAKVVFSQEREQFIVNVDFQDVDVATLPNAKSIYFYAKGIAVDSIREQNATRTKTGYRLILPRTEFAPPDLEVLEGLLYTNQKTRVWPGIEGQYLKIKGTQK